MSLLVWLPLTGDLENKGASTIQATGTNITSNTNGKIGSCYSFNGSSSYIKLNTAPLNNNTREFSYCCWLKPNSQHNGCLFSNRTNSNDVGITIFYYTTQFLFDVGGRWTFTPGTAVQVNAWNHLAFTYKQTEGRKIYLNGTLIGSNTTSVTPAQATTTNAFIGASQNSTTGVNANYLNGYLNDVRIYNHCLSAAEVHEISQGLVLHYKLDSGSLPINKNIVGRARYAETASSGWGAHRGASTQVDIDTTAPVPWHKGTKLVVTYDTSLGSGGGCGFYLGEFATSSNTTYCYSLYIQAPDDMSYIHANWLYRYEYNASGTQQIEAGVAAKARSISLGNHWYRIWGTFTTKAETTKSRFYFYTYSGKNITYYFCCPQVELGTVMTSWSDGEVFTTIPDSSGYGHLGIINDTALKLVSDTARYSAAIQNSQANNSAIFPFKGQVDMPDSSALTFSWWMKPTTWGIQTSGIFSTSAGDSPTDYSTTAANMRDSCFDCCNTNGTCVRINVANYLTLNEWHHYTLTYNGSQLNFYKDGVSKVTASQSGSLKAFKNIFPFYSKAGGVNRCTSGSLSDFRIYATALSAVDVKSLYEVSTKVDNKGGIHSYELDELYGNISEARFINNSATSMSYDTATDTYTIVSPVGTSSWGYGVRLADTPALNVPYGMAYRWTAEVYVPTTLTVVTDYNNTASTTWNGNDNDLTSSRLESSNSIPANTWTKIIRGSINTHASNTSHLPIRDYSSLGLVTNGQSGPVTWYVRHLQWYLVDTADFKTKVKKTGQFTCTHFTELGNTAKISKKIQSTIASEFIEF